MLWGQCCAVHVEGAATDRLEQATLTFPARIKARHRLDQMRDGDISRCEGCRSCLCCERGDTFLRRFPAEYCTGREDTSGGEQQFGGAAA